MLSILFTLAIGLVGWSTYRSWQSGPWVLPAPSKSIAKNALPQNPAPPSVRAPVNTEIIVSKNLFDPERGAGATRVAEQNSEAFQRVRDMILMGTVIIGNNRVAILQDGTPSSSSRAGQRGSEPTPAPMRLKVGDNVDGFRLTEIADKKVVFAKDAARVEVALDYFRKVEEAPPPPKPPVRSQVSARRRRGARVPRVVPTLPRRGRIPVPANPSPES